MRCLPPGVVPKLRFLIENEGPINTWTVIDTINSLSRQPEWTPLEVEQFFTKSGQEVFYFDSGKLYLRDDSDESSEDEAPHCRQTIAEKQSCPGCIKLLSRLEIHEENAQFSRETCHMLKDQIEKLQTQIEELAGLLSEMKTARASEKKSSSHKSLSEEEVEIPKTYGNRRTMKLKMHSDSSDSESEESSVVNEADTFEAKLAAFNRINLRREMPPRKKIEEMVSTGFDIQKPDQTDKVKLCSSDSDSEDEDDGFVCIKAKRKEPRKIESGDYDGPCIPNEVASSPVRTSHELNALGAAASAKAMVRKAETSQKSTVDIFAYKEEMDFNDSNFREMDKILRDVASISKSSMDEARMYNLVFEHFQGGDTSSLSNGQYVAGILALMEADPTREFVNQIRESVKRRDESFSQLSN